MKKAAYTAGKAVAHILLAFVILVMIVTVMSVVTGDKNSAGLFGYKPYIVLSDSMRGTFAVGDVAVSKRVETDTLQAGDTVTFHSIDPDNYNQVVTHKIREITSYEGKPAFVTYGAATGANDAYPVPFDNIIGEYRFRLPKMGYFFQFLKTPAGYVAFILIPFLLLIALHTVRFFRLVRRYKAEQRAEIAVQTAKAEAERLKAQQMRDELERLRARMTDNTAGEREAVAAFPHDAGGES